jgi:hypothetical protein
MMASHNILGSDGTRRSEAAVAGACAERCVFLERKWNMPDLSGNRATHDDRGMRGPGASDPRPCCSQLCFSRHHDCPGESLRLVGDDGSFRTRRTAQLSRNNTQDPLCPWFCGMLLQPHSSQWRLVAIIRVPRRLPIVVRPCTASTTTASVVVGTYKSVPMVV